MGRVIGPTRVATQGRPVRSRVALTQMSQSMTWERPKAGEGGWGKTWGGAAVRASMDGELGD